MHQFQIILCLFFQVFIVRVGEHSLQKEIFLLFLYYLHIINKNLIYANWSVFIIKYIENV